MTVDIRAAYRRAWSYTPPSVLIEMHAAGLFQPLREPRLRWRQELGSWLDTGKPPRLVFSHMEIDTPEDVVEGDAFVREHLIDGLYPLAGDHSGDRWCFDARRKLHGTTAIVYAPHDGGGAEYVAPSFAGFVYRLLIQNLQDLESFESWGFSRDEIRRVVQNSLNAARPWLLRRWARDVEEQLRRKTWPKLPLWRERHEYFQRDPAFARLPKGEFEHFRRGA